MSNYKEGLTQITTFIFDYDGVLTNGVVLITNTGDQLRTGHVKDGYALQLAVKSGWLARYSRLVSSADKGAILE